MMVLRYSWGEQGVGQKPTGFFWILSLVALWLWWSALSSGLRANAKNETYKALVSIPVVSASELQTKFAEYENGPVAVTDVAYCLEKPSPDPETGAVPPESVAIRTAYSGQEEIEGEESDWIETRNYGVDAEVFRFALGAADSPVQVDNDNLTILTSRPTERVTINTNEFSPAANGNLQEYQDRQVIPCGTNVTVTGLVVKEGNVIALAPLPKSVAIVTDRPWSTVMEEAGIKVKQQGTGVTMWFLASLIFGLAQLAMGLSGRPKAG
jgi:hypothetical protein